MPYTFKIIQPLTILISADKNWSNDKVYSLFLRVTQENKSGCFFNTV